METPRRRPIWAYMSIARTPFPTRALLLVTVILVAFLIIAAITEAKGASGPRPLPPPAASTAPKALGNGQFLFYPQSARVKSGVPYRFSILTHCGLDFPIAVDFDGSFWSLPSGSPWSSGNAPPGFGNPTDRGVIILTSPTQAEYHSANGQLVLFQRHSGAVITALCS